MSTLLFSTQCVNFLLGRTSPCPRHSDRGQPRHEGPTRTATEAANTAKPDHLRRWLPAHPRGHPRDRHGRGRGACPLPAGEAGCPQGTGGWSGEPTTAHAHGAGTSLPELPWYEVQRREGDVKVRWSGGESGDAISIRHRPLTRYVQLRVAHAPGMSGMFSPPPTSKETAN